MVSKEQDVSQIDRRKLLKLGAGSTLALPMLLPRPLAAANDDFDVVVVGAGISGLAAAKTLRNLGYSVVVLEAADRPGGRISTDWRLGAPIEVGAGWIHGPDDNPITDLATAAGASLYRTDDRSFQVFSADGKRLEKDEIFKKYKRLRWLYGRIDATFGKDQSLEKAIRRISKKDAADPILQWMSSAYTEFDSGGPLDQLSAFYFDEDKAFDGEDVILASGYDQVFASGFLDGDIRLNTVVETIDYEEGDGATVVTNQGAYEADFVICTVPLGVLQQENIEFDPPLPKSITDRIARIGMGNVTKLALKFEEPFWPLDVQYLGAMTADRGRWNYFMNYRTFSEENILVGLSVGEYAQIAEQMDDADMLEDCMSVVRATFGAHAPEPVGFLATRWSLDPYTHGAYSYVRVGSKPGDFDGLAKPIAKTILLAGEHTTFEYHATVHGAYLSGVRAAEIIDDQLAD